MFEIGEEVVAFIIHDDECRKVLDIYLAYRFHAEFRKIDHLHALDALLGQNGGRSANRAEVETAMFPTCVGNLLRTVALATMTIDPPLLWNKST